MAETTETMTFKIYVRVGDDGSTAAVTEYEQENGTIMDDAWSTIDATTHHDHVISVTVPLPLPLDQMPAGASVTLDAPAPGIAAAPAT